MFGDLQALIDAYDQAPYMCLVVEAGPELRVLAANGQARVASANRALIGLPLWEAYGDLAPPGYLDLYRQTAETGEAQSLVEWRAHLVNPDGGELAIWLDF